MTLSTNDISSVCMCPCSSEDARQEGALEGWRKELHRRIILSEDSCSDFLLKYVPSQAPCPPSGDVADAFVKFALWEPEEEDTYQHLLEGLAALVSSFPSDKRPSFLDCLEHMQQFPFSAFAETHRSTYLDIGVSFPGQSFDEDESPNWFSFSLVMTSKPEPQEDPFRNRRHKPCKALVQLAVLAHNLMHAHGLTCAFVFGIYGDTIRICRFDHSGVVVCQPLSLKRVADLKILQQFFWNFVHPTEEGPFVGWDPTVRRMSVDDEAWLLARLALANFDTRQLTLSEARSVQAFDGESDGGHEAQTYIAFNLLDISTRLFSRATTVWRAIRDTRRRVDGRLVDPPPAPDDLRVRIIKESWRPLFRRSEKDFYDRLDSAIPQRQRVGLPSLVYGSDMGEREVRLWESALYGALEPTAPDGAHHKTRLSTPALRKPPLSPPPSLFCAVSTDQSDVPTHHPLQQTFTWRQARGAKYWYRERSHVRLVVGEVGRPVTRFRSTKELVRAFRDAIIGHRDAMAKGGILHRDISVGNILIVDDPALQDDFCGFIHDFDYSSMTSEVPQDDILSLPAEAVNELLLANDIYGFLIQRTGTWNYMATELLPATSNRIVHTARHDLESFYWTLLWVVLRHTMYTVANCKGQTRQQTCDDVFTKVSALLAGGSKLLWLKYYAKNLEIARNRPLTDLMKEFALLVKDAVPGKSLDYDNVLALFDAALAAASWPEVADGPLEYVSESREEFSPDRPHRHRRKRASANLERSSSVSGDESDDSELWQSDDDDAPRLAINGADNEDEDDEDCDMDDQGFGDDVQDWDEDGQGCNEDDQDDQDSVDFGWEFPPAGLSRSELEDWEDAADVSLILGYDVDLPEDADGDADPLPGI